MDAVAEPCQVTAETPIKPAKRSLFTPENAKIMRQRSEEAKKRNKLAMEQRLQAAEAQAAIAQPLIAAAVAKTVQNPASYLQERLSRTREQIAALDDQMRSAVNVGDSKAIQAISVAVKNLYEIEGNLAGRPKPGVRRPGREKPVRAGAGEAPLMED